MWALLAVSAAALTACGGGAEDSTIASSQGAMAFASSMANQPAARALGNDRKVRLAATSVNGVDANLLMDWAEFKFAELLPKARVRKYQLEYLGKNYSVREYTVGNVVRYLGVTDLGEVYGLGDFTNDALQPYGVIADWAAQVLQDRCSVNATLCNNPPPAGPLNSCTMPASQYLSPGNRFNAVYTSSGTVVSETTTESTVEANGTFDGRTGVRVRSTSSSNSTTQGFTISVGTNIDSWHQAGNGGLLLTLGSEGSTTSGGVVFNGVTIGGTTTPLRVVYNPADTNLQFTLGLGQSMTKYTTAVITTAGVPVPLISGINYTYEANEDITVLGRTYATCRYLETAQDGMGGTTRVWYIRGKGAPARTVSTATGPQGTTEVTTIDLKSGSINGQPL
jgi:hypothetical protein